MLNFHEKLVPVSAFKHQGLNWIPPQDYTFAASEQFLPVNKRDLPQAAATLPIMIQEGSPVLMTSLVPGENHYINDKGKLRGKYAPIVLRTYPFARGRDQSTNNYILGVEESFVVDPETPESKPILTEEAQIAPNVKRIMWLLQRMDRERQELRKACAILDKLGVLRDRPIKVQMGQEKEHQIQGLKIIDRKALNGLTQEDAVKLYEYGALELAYTQIVSMHHMTKLHKWAKALRKQAKQKEELAFELFQEYDDEDMKLDFDNIEDE